MKNLDLIRIITQAIKNLDRIDKLLNSWEIAYCQGKKDAYKEILGLLKTMIK